MSAPNLRTYLILVTCAVLMTASPAALGVAAQRTFVKSTGVDNPACSLAAPCRSFAAAMLQTLPGGEVIVLDSAGYGSVTIAQSVSIIAPAGVYAGITVSSGDGVTINGAGIVVVLQGLSINGTGGNRGIHFTQGAELHIRNCSIANMTTGLQTDALYGATYVSDTDFRANGVSVTNGSFAIFARVAIENNGLFANGSWVSVQESRISGSVNINAVGATARMTLDQTLISDSGGAALNAYGGDSGSAYVDVARSLLVRSVRGVAIASSPFAGIAVVTIAASTLSDNLLDAVLATTIPTGAALALVNGNTVSRNGGGLNGGSGAVGDTGIVHTRSNNSGEQTVPTSGTVTAVPGF
jgi:hypothetical protein